MAEMKKNEGNNVFSENDPLDINELASLDEEITPEFINNLQSKITGETVAENDGVLFEEPVKRENENKSHAKFNDDIDDNFIKKYKAKLKRQQVGADTEEALPDNTETPPPPEPQVEAAPVAEPPAPITEPPGPITEPPAPKEDIEKVSGGNITEKPITDDYIEYKDSLDYIDGNVKYSKYVVYIDPENKDFMDSLTVKERKNLINRIIREQDSITVTKRKLNKMHVILVHAIVAILTIVIAIPCIYWAINASLEATINNYRSSQNAFEQLYKEYGKIKR